ncbi:MAG TPA: sn-glycerol-3-phosphate ABC transporter ATP-binding protein UgpC [Terriglobia bacterium]|nr:sn-glycerol-3-phosphate ABC transporter ATP-binding protein UgpC [Terriglobia bacterium]
MAEVRTEKLCKSYGAAEILKDIDLTVEDGSFVVLVGPSGCGKSTLLRTIAGLEQSTTGKIEIGGRKVNDLPPAQRQIAMVFQSYALYPHMDVRGNMGFGLKFAGFPKAEIERRVQEAARILKLEALLARKPRDLSGGQRQRVAIGRAIVREPEVFLFDEPLSNLDAALRVNTRIELAKLHRMLKATIVYVTHDQVEAMTLADKIVVMNKGRIEQAGKPMELYYHPANLFVAGFIGSPAMNFVPGRIAGVTEQAMVLQGDDGLQLTLPRAGWGAAAINAGDQVTLGLRPEHLKVAAGATTSIEAGTIALDGTIDLIERLGDIGYAHIRLGGGGGAPLVAEIRGAAALDINDRCSISTDFAHLHLFDAEGRAFSKIAAREAA